MSFGVDKEILKDFLIETGEILDLLQEQLISLENNPNDIDLINSIFRGFHTVKGGAGFLSLTPMIELCHQAENIFDLLRNKQLTVTPELMDVILQSLDLLIAMYDETKEGKNQTPVSKDTLKQLNVWSSDILKEIKSNDEEIVETSSINNSDDITDDEFENLLDTLHGKGQFKIDLNAYEEKDSLSNNGADNLDTKNSETTLNSNNPSSLLLKNKNEDNNLITIQKKEIPEPQKVINNIVSQNAETTVRVDTNRLDDIMNMVGELVLVRNRLLSLGNMVENQEIAKSLVNLDVVTSDLQASVMKTRMQPIKKIFGRFPRVVRDLARSLKKEVELVLEGEATDLDKNLVEALADPLIHLIRNAVDHGIESPYIRLQNNKPKKGVIKLSASHNGDHISLKIEDDGKGIDPEDLKAFALTNKIIDEVTARAMSDTDAYNLIFAPGFSTKQKISDISGRGVGMDVVKNRITSLNGSVKVFSKLGHGTSVDIKVPLTLAIMPTLMIGISNKIFALPLSSVNEIFNLDLSKTNIVDGQLTVVIRNKAVPLFYLADWLSSGEKTQQLTDKDNKNKHVVIIKKSNLVLGFIVDKLIGQEEVVVKALTSIIKGTPGMSGATITSNGRIALILDIAGLVKHYANQYSFYQ